MQISGITPITTPLIPATPTASPKEGASSFGTLLEQAVASLDGLQEKATDAAVSLASGNGVELHGALIATEEANLAFQLALQMRNKLIEAYQEVMRMQV